jgi:hypothetical protein
MNATTPMMTNIIVDCDNLLAVEVPVEVPAAVGVFAVPVEVPAVVVGGFAALLVPVGVVADVAPRVDVGVPSDVLIVVLLGTVLTAGVAGLSDRMLVQMKLIFTPVGCCHSTLATSSAAYRNSVPLLSTASLAFLPDVPVCQRTVSVAEYSATSPVSNTRRYAWGSDVLVSQIDPPALLLTTKFPSICRAM